MDSVLVVTAMLLLISTVPDMPTVVGMGTRGMDMEAMRIKAMGIEGRGSSSARASSSPSEHTGGHTGSPILIRPL